MLILGRKLNQSILVDTGKDKIRLFCVAIRGNAIRLGFDAPKHVTINRDNIVLVRGKKKTVSQSETEDQTPVGPNVEVARLLREYADGIERLDFPINVFLESFGLKGDQVEQFKVAVNDAEFSPNSYKGQSWIKAQPIEGRVSITVYSPKTESLEVPA